MGQKQSVYEINPSDKKELPYQINSFDSKKSQPRLLKINSLDDRAFSYVPRSLIFLPKQSVADVEKKHATDIEKKMNTKKSSKIEDKNNKKNLKKELNNSNHSLDQNHDKKLSNIKESSMQTASKIDDENTNSKSYQEIEESKDSKLDVENNIIKSFVVINKIETTEYQSKPELDSNEQNKKSIITLQYFNNCEKTLYNIQDDSIYSNANNSLTNSNEIITLEKIEANGTSDVNFNEFNNNLTYVVSNNNDSFEHVNEDNILKKKNGRNSTSIVNFDEFKNVNNDILTENNEKSPMSIINFDELKSNSIHTIDDIDADDEDDESGINEKLIHQINNKLKNKTDKILTLPKSSNELIHIVFKQDHANIISNNTTLCTSIKSN